LCNGSKALLSGSVPDLQFHFRSIDVEHFDFEVDPDCRDIGLPKFTLTKGREQVGFTNSTIANDDNFKDFRLLLIFLSHIIFLLNIIVHSIFLTFVSLQ